MFGVFKKLFSRSSSPPPAAAPVTQTSVQTPTVAPPRTSTPTAPGATTRTFKAAAPAAARGTGLAGDKIALPLKEIFLHLPEDLAALVVKPPGGTFSLSASVAVEQLRTGAVRIPLAQLRQAVPPGTFTDDTSRDDSLIDLPLGLILGALGPAGLARRTNQKRTEVPDEVVGVFGAKNKGAKAPAAAGSAPVATPMAAKPATTAAAAPMPSAPQPVATAPVAAAIPTPSAQKAVAPVGSPPTAPKQTTYITQSSAATSAPVSAPLPFVASKSASPLPFATTRPTPPPPPAPTAVAPAASGELVVMTVETVSGAWPDAVRQEVLQFNLGSASISIPINRIEPGVKTGRIVFTWAELGGWLSEPLPASAHGPSELELPLHIIAPLFLAKRRATTPRKIVTVGQDVPDLFAGRSKAAPAPEPVEEPVAAPVVAEEPAIAIAAPEAPEEISEPPLEADASPEEVMERILALPGVAGALLASQDGLLVAGQLPAPLEAETMAAFLPQILMRIGICTEEIRLGKLRSVMLFVGQTPCAMFKAGTLCLAVLGHAGQTLPLAALERLAGGLAQQND